MLSVITWKWHTPGYRSKFTADHVNTMRRMVRRNYGGDHVFKCVTDDAAGLDYGIQVIPLPQTYASLKNPHGAKHPSCYRRLTMFSPFAADVFGRRFVSLDLDCVVTGDLAPLFDRPVDFAMWSDPLNAGQYNGSLLLMTADSRSQVWTDFNPERSPQEARAAGFKGSDQAWVSYKLPKEATFTTADGVYSYRKHLKGHRELPENAVVAVFHGRPDPWDDEAQKLPWVRSEWL